MTRELGSKLILIFSIYTCDLCFRKRHATPYPSVLIVEAYSPNLVYQLQLPIHLMPCFLLASPCKQLSYNLFLDIPRFQQADHLCMTFCTSSVKGKPPFAAPGCNHRELA